MSSKKQGAAKKAAPKKATPRKKPGPAARAKARQAQVSTSFPLPEPRSTVDIVGSMRARTDALAAQARLDNARAEELEIQNRYERQIKGFDDGPSKPAFTLTPEAGHATASELADSAMSAIDLSRNLVGGGAQQSRRNTIDDALEANYGCLCYTDDLVGRLEKVLQPLLRPVETKAADRTAAPAPVESELAARVRSHTGRNAEVNARLMALLDRLDLPN